MTVGAHLLRLTAGAALFVAATAFSTRVPGGEGASSGATVDLDRFYGQHISWQG